MEIICRLKTLWHILFPKSRKRTEIPLEHNHSVIQGYHAMSNKWGIFKLPQRKTKELQIDMSDIGWTINTPTKNYGVLAYPKVSLDPTKAHLLYEVDTTFEPCKKYNLSVDLFVGSHLWNGVTHEIMVWEDYNRCKPAGKKKGTFGPYDVYRGYIDKTKEPSLGTPGWNYTAFVRREPVSDGILDIEGFLREAGEPAGTIPLILDFGTEVYNAAGTIEILDLRQW